MEEIKAIFKPGQLWGCVNSGMYFVVNAIGETNMLFTTVIKNDQFLEVRIYYFMLDGLFDYVLIADNDFSGNVYTLSSEDKELLRLLRSKPRLSMNYQRFVVKFYVNGEYYTQEVSATSAEKAEDFVIAVYSRKNMAVDIITTIKIS